MIRGESKPIPFIETLVITTKRSAINLQNDELAANEALMNGDTTGAFSQVNLAYLQLAMIETDII